MPGEDVREALKRYRAKLQQHERQGLADSVPLAVDAGDLRTLCDALEKRWEEAWLCPRCEKDRRTNRECCNPSCGGQWGTGCYCCHHPKYVKRALEEAETASAVLERVKKVLRMPGTGSYVEWAEECREAWDEAAERRAQPLICAQWQPGKEEPEPCGGGCEPCQQRGRIEKLERGGEVLRSALANAESRATRAERRVEELKRLLDTVVPLLPQAWAQRYYHALLTKLAHGDHSGAASELLNAIGARVRLERAAPGEGEAVDWNAVEAVGAPDGRRDDHERMADMLRAYHEQTGGRR